MDETFLLFRSTEHVENKQNNIDFTSEIEQNCLLSFLEIKISRDKNNSVTSVGRKPIFNEVFINFESFISKS